MPSRFAARSHAPELMDDLSLANDALRQNLEELEVINRYLGGNQVVVDALRQLLRLKKPAHGGPLRVVDLGCGGGDTLRAIADWAARQHLAVSLTGVDANPFMLDFARQKAQSYTNISFAEANVFDDIFYQQQPADVFICSLFCHHFTNSELVQLLRRLHQWASVGLIINDLHRHWLAYHSIRFLTWAFRGSYLVRHDAPLSVLRAFSRRELQTLLTQSNIAQYQLRWKWAFRYQIVAWKTA